MKIQKVIPGTKTFRSVKELYDTAFPAEEQLPFSRMALLSVLKPSVELLAYYDGDTFCGFSFAVCTGRYLYINFFAVVSQLRSHGYGARMLECLRKRHPLAAVCDAKAPEQQNDTYATDLRRVQFWERNGFDFFGGQYPITNPCGVKYLVGATEAPFDRQAYRAIFDHLSFGPGAQLRILKRHFRK